MEYDTVRANFTLQRNQPMLLQSTLWPQTPILADTAPHRSRD